MLVIETFRCTTGRVSGWASRRAGCVTSRPRSCARYRRTASTPTWTCPSHRPPTSTPLGTLYFLMPCYLNLYIHTEFLIYFGSKIPLFSVIYIMRVRNISKKKVKSYMKIHRKHIGKTIVVHNLCHTVQHCMTIHVWQILYDHTGTWHAVIHIVICMIRHVERYDTWSNIVRLCMSYMYDMLDCVSWA